MKYKSEEHRKCHKEFIRHLKQRTAFIKKNGHKAQRINISENEITKPKNKHAGDSTYFNPKWQSFNNGLQLHERI